MDLAAALAYQATVTDAGKLDEMLGSLFSKFNTVHDN